MPCHTLVTRCVDDRVSSSAASFATASAPFHGASANQVTTAQAVATTIAAMPTSTKVRSARVKGGSIFCVSATKKTPSAPLEMVTVIR
jgi:hypothetical protein